MGRGLSSSEARRWLAPQDNGETRSDGGLTDRADLEQLAVVTRLQRNPQLAPAVESGHDRHHGHDGFAPAVIERGLHARLLAEPDQVAGGRERQLEPSTLTACQCL